MTDLIERLKTTIKDHFVTDASGHDWFHIERVYSMACFLQSKEGGKLDVIQLASLLHDISDHKMNGGILNAGGEIAYHLLLEHGCEKELALTVKEIVDGVSFKGANVPDAMTTLEGKIVQDADRLDAIGAIGIARAFAFGGNKNRPMYTPTVAPELHNTFEQYASAQSHTINHFYEKLLLINERLHTTTAKKIGTQRHRFMENYLTQFFNEWNTTNLEEL